MGLICSGAALGGLLLVILGLCLARKRERKRRLAVDSPGQERQGASSEKPIRADSPQEAAHGLHGENKRYELHGQCMPAEMDGAQTTQEVHEPTGLPGQALRGEVNQELDGQRRPGELPRSQQKSSTSSKHGSMAGVGAGSGGHQGGNTVSVHQGQLFELE